VNDFLPLYILNIFPAFVILSMGIYILYKNGRDPLNQAFGLSCILICINGISAPLYRGAINLPDVKFWYSFYVSSLLFSLAAYLQFCIVYYLKQPIKRLSIYAGIYFPMLVIFFLDKFTTLINITFIRSAVGFYYAVSGPLDIIRYPILVAYPFIGIIFLQRAYSEAPDPTSKKQALMMIVGTMFPLIIGSFTDEILPIFTNRYLPLLMFSFTFMSIFIFIAITRYRFAQISPDMAVEDTIAAIPDALLTTDLKGNISYCNKYSTELFGDALVNKNFLRFSQNHSLKQNFELLLSRSIDHQRFETALRRSDGSAFLSETNCSIIKGPGGSSYGLLWNIRDLTSDFDLKNALLKKQKELEERIKELGRMNEFMSGREERLDELRKEIEELKAKPQA